jgi:hypothetical protein
MKWELADAIDVNEIIRRGDLNAVEFYLRSFVHANVTRQDAAHFGSKGALKLFMVMQLGIDYLLQQTENYAMNSAHCMEWARANAEVSSSCAASLDECQRKLAESESAVARLKREVISLNEANEKSKKVISKLRKKLEMSRRRSPLQKIKRKGIEVEPGLVSTDHHMTGLEEIQRLAEWSKTERTDAQDLSIGEWDPSAFSRSLPKRRESPDEFHLLWPEGTI